MPTILRKLPQANPDSVGIPGVAPSDAELTIFNYPGTFRWYRADTAVSTTEKTWRCRKSDALLIPASNGFPVVQPSNPVFNNQQTLQFNGTPARLISNGSLPQGTVSFLLVARPGPGDNVNYFGDRAAGENTCFQHRGAGDGFQTWAAESLGTGGRGASALGGLARTFADGANLWIGSASRRVSNETDMMLRTNRGAHVTSFLYPAEAPLGTVNNDLSVGGNGIDGTVQGPGDGMEMADLILFNSDLKADPAFVAVCEAYAGSRYGFVAP